MSSLRAIIEQRRAKASASSAPAAVSKRFVRRGELRAKGSTAGERRGRSEQDSENPSSEAESQPRKRSRTEPSTNQASAGAKSAAPDIPGASQDKDSFDRACSVLRSQGMPIRLFGESEQDVARRASQYSRGDDVLGTRLGLEHHLGVRRRTGMEGLQEYGAPSIHEAGKSAPPSLPAGSASAGAPAPSSSSFSSSSSMPASATPSHSLSSSADQFSLAGAQFVPPRDRAEALSRMARVAGYFQGLLRGWENECEAREQGVAGAREGKGGTAADRAVGTSQRKRIQAELRRCSEYLLPLWGACREGTLPLDVLGHLEGMAGALAKGSVTRALQHHVQWSVGEQDWIVGVTTTGIHARAGRNKLFEQDVAHVMNDERQRKMAVGIRALIAFAQRSGEGVSARKSAEVGSSAGNVKKGSS